MRLKNFLFILFSIIILASCAKDNTQINTDLDFYFMSDPVDTIATLFAPDIISTGHHEYSSVIISPDNSIIFFTIADNP